VISFDRLMLFSSPVGVRLLRGAFYQSGSREMKNISCARFAKYRLTHSAARRIQECESLRTTVSGPE